VLGKLKQRKFNFTINAKCANSDRDIEIVLNSDLEISHLTKGATPMFCLPIVPLANTKQPSIVDIF
jgi:hypothetical protein